MNVGYFFKRRIKMLINLGAVLGIYISKVKSSHWENEQVMYNFQREGSFQAEENRRQKSPLSPIKKKEKATNSAFFLSSRVEIIF